MLRISTYGTEARDELAEVTQRILDDPDYERLPARHESMVCWAMAITMSRRLACQRPAARISAA